MRPTVRRRIFLGLMGALVLFVIVVNFSVQFLLNNIAEQEIVKELETAVLAYRRYDDQRQELLNSRVVSLSQIPHLVATLEIPGVDEETIRVAVDYLDSSLKFDLLLLLDDVGEPLMNSNNQQAILTGLDLESVYQSAYAGESFTDTWEVENGIFEIASAPIISNIELLGLIIIGIQVDNLDSIQVVKEISGTQAYWSKRDMLLPPEVLPLGKTDVYTSPPEVINYSQLDNTIFSRMKIGSERFVRAEIIYPDLLSSLNLLAQVDIGESGVARVRNFLLLISSLALLIGIYMAHRIAVKISNPILMLTNAASEFGKGKELDRVVPQSEDEIGVLTETFNDMADEIVIKRQSLIASLKEARAANRAKSEFLARISHEIRTPMNGVLGMAQLLQNTDLDDSQRDYADIIIQSGDHLLHIINDILDFSKIESGSMVLNKSFVDLVELVKACLDVFVEAANQNGLTLEFRNRSTKNTQVWGDPVKLRQVLINLIGNAIKFTTKGGVIVSLSNCEDSSNKEMYRFEVEDSGIGIDFQNTQKIFEPFVQEDESDTRKYGGTGLGLSISKQIVVLMDGEIGVGQSMSGGCVFWFTAHLPEKASSNLDVSLSV